MRKFFFTLVATSFLFSCNPKTQKELPQDSMFRLSSVWENQNGKKLQLKELRGKVIVLVMIYTSCKTACPQLTARMKQIAKKVGKVNPEEIQYVFVSIDPEVDTPERMKAYFKMNDFVGGEWLFLRGNETTTREFANVVAMKYKQISPVDFSHSNIISVFAKDGTLAYQREGLDIDVEPTVQEIKKQLEVE